MLYKGAVCAVWGYRTYCVRVQVRCVRVRNVLCEGARCGACIVWRHRVWGMCAVWGYRCVVYVHYVLCISAGCVCTQTQHTQLRVGKITNDSTRLHNQEHSTIQNSSVHYSMNLDCGFHITKAWNTSLAIDCLTKCLVMPFTQSPSCRYLTTQSHEKYFATCDSLQPEYAIT